MATPEEISQVRALIDDSVREDYDGTGELRYALPDESLETYITLRKGGIYGAAADALRAMAALEIRVGKYLRTEDLQTDGARVGDALRLLAREYDKRQAEDDDSEALENHAFEIVDFKYPYVNPEDSYFLRGL